MHYPSIANVLGKLLLITAGSMMLPVLVCLYYYNEGDLIPILLSVVITTAVGLPMWWLFRNNHDLGAKDGIFIAFLDGSWFLPFLVCRS